MTLNYEWMSQKEKFQKFTLLSLPFTFRAWFVQKKIVYAVRIPPKERKKDGMKRTKSQVFSCGNSAAQATVEWNWMRIPNVFNAFIYTTLCITYMCVLCTHRAT